MPTAQEFVVAVRLRARGQDGATRGRRLMRAGRNELRGYK
jgi:hypothetical protein